MKKLTRIELKELFEDTKHFRINEEFDEVSFDSLFYYSFYDGTDNVFYTVCEFGGKLVGIRWNVFRPSVKPLSLGLCDVCRKHRRRDEIISIYSQTKNLAKNMNYRTKGFFICFDFIECNKDLKNLDGIFFIYDQIINK